MYYFTAWLCLDQMDLTALPDPNWINGEAKKEKGDRKEDEKNKWEAKKKISHRY